MGSSGSMRNRSCEKEKKGGSYFPGGKGFPEKGDFSKKGMGGSGVLEKKIYRRGLSGPYLILMGSETSDDS